MPKVSVLLTNYNYAAYLPGAVESVLAQEGPEFELIAVDDGSSDGSAAYLQSLRDERVRVVCLPRNRGRCRAANEACSLATGEYIAFMDADDMWLPGKLALQTAMLDGDPSLAAVASQVKFIDVQGRGITAAAGDLAKVFNQPGPSRFDMLRTMFFSGNFLNTSSILLRRSFLDPAELFFDIRLKHLHDQDLWVRLLLRGHIPVIPKPFVAYRVHAVNDSLAGKSVRERSFLESALILERFARLDDPALFANIFPEAQHFRPVTRENIPYYTARLAMGQENPLCVAWGRFLLSRLMKTEQGAKAIEEEFGLTLQDYYKL